MRSLIRLAAALALLAALPSLALAAEALTVRVYPAQAARTYPLDSIRNVQGLLVQYVAAANGSDGPLTVTGVEYELLDKGVTVDRRTLDGAMAGKAAASTYQLQAMGQLDTVAFLYGDVLGSPRARLASSATVKPGEALMLAQQAFAWKGSRDTLRITVHATDASGAALYGTVSLPIVPLGEPRYVFPLEGRWFVGAAPTFHSHHRWATPEEFALDIFKVGADGISYGGDGSKLTDYRAYGATVRAAAEGEVVAVVSDQPEDLSWLKKPGEDQGVFMMRIIQAQNTLFARGPDAPAGNFVIIRHPWGEYSMYAHLQPGSPLVKVGDKVTARQPLGRLGHSGGSTEPHLHFQVCDRPSPLSCAGIPAAFKDLEIPTADFPRPVQTGDFVVAH